MWLQRLTSATLPGTPLQHRTVTVQSRMSTRWGKRLWMCALVELFRKLLICWGFLDTTLARWCLEKKNKRRHQVSPSSESKCVTDASSMPTAYLSVLADHVHPFVTTVRRLPMATLSRWFTLQWIISKWFLEHDTSVHYTRSYPQPNIAPFGWVGTGDSYPGCCSL